MGVLFRDLGIPSKRVKNPLKFVLNGANLIDHYHRLLVIFSGADTLTASTFLLTTVSKKTAYFMYFSSVIRKTLKNWIPHL